jgi:hypothetical protein
MTRTRSVVVDHTLPAAGGVQAYLDEQIRLAHLAAKGVRIFVFPELWLT